MYLDSVSYVHIYDASVSEIDRYLERLQTFEGFTDLHYVNYGEDSDGMSFLFSADKSPTDNSHHRYTCVSIWVHV